MVLACKYKVGLDYIETFDTIAEVTVVRALLLVAAMRYWNTNQVNISNVFLYGYLYKEVYVQLLQGHKAPSYEIPPFSAQIAPAEGSGQACRLLKSLYCLK